MIEQGSPEWLRARATAGIGGSEAAALFGLGFTSQWALWASKTGRLEGEQADIWRSPQLWWGNRLEQAVREAYQASTGRTVSDGHTMHPHPRGLPMFANTDGLIPIAEGWPGPGIYEGKSATTASRGRWRSEEGDPMVPLSYQIQAQHYLACTGLEWASIAVYFGDHKAPEVFDLPRNDRFIAELERRCSAFWADHVLTDLPPPIDDSERTEQALRTASPDDNGRAVALPDGFKFLRDAWDMAEQIERTAKTAIQFYQNLVIATIGDAAYGLTFDGQGFTFRSGAKGRTLRRASEAAMSKALRRCDPPTAVMISPSTARALALLESAMVGRLNYTPKDDQ
jgi:putative phage-type endonuclease